MKDRCYNALTRPRPLPPTISRSRSSCSILGADPPKGKIVVIVIVLLFLCIVFVVVGFAYDMRRIIDLQGSRFSVFAFLQMRTRIGDLSVIRFQDYRRNSELTHQSSIINQQAKAKQ